MKIVASIAFVIFLLACAKSPDAKSTETQSLDLQSADSKAPDPKSPTKQGKTCGSGANAIVCAPDQFCGHAPAPPPLNRTEPVRPEDPVGSDVGGSCGGVAGFHCRAGLVCEMPPDQANVADGMGSCVLPWTCVNGIH